MGLRDLSRRQITRVVNFKNCWAMIYSLAYVGAMASIYRVLWVQIGKLPIGDRAKGVLRRILAMAEAAAARGIDRALKW
jgi:hypothetical protein